MGESTVRQRTEAAAESLARRAEHGLVAGYIHELSQRHQGDAADFAARSAPEADGGG